MDDKVYILYYDLPAIDKKTDLIAFVDELIVPIMKKFEDAGKLAILLPKDEIVFKELTKEQALNQIDNIRRYIEEWPE